MKRAYALPLLTLFLFLAHGLFAQERIPAGIGGSRPVRLRGHRPAAALLSDDLGPADPGRPLSFVTLLFRRTPEQQADLDQLRQAQRDPASPDYHRWLSPQQFAHRFGLDPASFGRARDWLRAQGFAIQQEALSRTWIAFSGTAAQIDAAFQTALHEYRVNGTRHLAPASEPSVPGVLAPSVLALRGLDDFLGERGRRPLLSAVAPALAGGNGRNALSPADLEVVYGIAPLRSAGFDGAGQSIAIVGRSNFDLTDLQAFRTKFGLPAGDPQVVALADPGVSLNTADRSEASLDLEISAAVAPRAKQIYVYANNIEDAIQHVIDNALAPVLSSSFLNCERNFSDARIAALASYGQEADVKGITWVNASGDSGAAGCDAHSVTGAVAQNGLWVNAYAAIPEVTGVGGTEFAEIDPNSPGAVYWNSVNGPALASAAGYIPETAWNDSSTAGSLLASGGGASKFFPKPSWQSGMGVPDDGARDVPDLAFSSSGLHDGYAICNQGNCNLVAGGTSAATPLFAGSLVLLNQFLLKWNVLHSPGLGNINPTLYRLAQTPGTGFHDITSGSNAVPCASGSTDCEAGTLGFPAAPGYDLATGLGSIDLSQLFTAWLTDSARNLVLTTTSLKVAASTDRSTQTVAVTVGPATGATAPSGTVTLTVGAAELGSLTLNRGAAASTTTFSIFTAQMPQGANAITVRYAGNSDFAPSSASQSLLIPSKTTTKSSLQMFATPNPVERVPAAYGNAWNFRLTLRELNGVAADLTKFIHVKINGTDCLADTLDCSANIVQGLFGTTTLEAFGSVSIPLQLTPGSPSPAFPNGSTNLSAFASGSTASAKVILPPIPTPGALTIELDAPGATATASPIPTILTVPLLGRPSAANLQLSAMPSAVLRNPGASSTCQWSQRLVLRELAGTGITLTRFVSGGQDQSTSIATFFGGTRLAANSELTALMCWGGLSAPVLINYIVEGNDDNGNSVSAGLSSAYLNQPSSPTSLAVTSTNPALSGTLSLNSVGGSVVLAISTSAASQVWKVSVVAPGASPDWVKVYPTSGLGSADVYVAPASGLSAGTYNATLLFESMDAVPQAVPLSITYTVQ
jgi:hypothetical protein